MINGRWCTATELAFAPAIAVTMVGRKFMAFEWASQTREDEGTVWICTVLYLGSGYQKPQVSYPASLVPSRLGNISARGCVATVYL